MTFHFSVKVSVRLGSFYPTFLLYISETRIHVFEIFRVYKLVMYTIVCHDNDSMTKRTYIIEEWYMARSIPPRRNLCLLRKSILSPWKETVIKLSSFFFVWNCHSSAALPLSPLEYDTFLPSIRTERQNSILFAEWSFSLTCPSKWRSNFVTWVSVQWRMKRIPRKEEGGKRASSTKEEEEKLHVFHHPLRDDASPSPKNYLIKKIEIVNSI